MAWVVDDIIRLTPRRCKCSPRAGCAAGAGNTVNGHGPVESLRLGGRREEEDEDEDEDTGLASGSGSSLGLVWSSLVWALRCAGPVARIGAEPPWRFRSLPACPATLARLDSVAAFSRPPAAAPSCPRQRASPLALARGTFSGRLRGAGNIKARQAGPDTQESRGCASWLWTQTPAHTQTQIFVREMGAAAGAGANTPPGAMSYDGPAVKEIGSALQLPRPAPASLPLDPRRSALAARPRAGGSCSSSPSARLPPPPPSLDEPPTGRLRRERVGWMAPRPLSRRAWGLRALRGPLGNGAGTGCRPRAEIRL
ncbi:unnamed protein product [Diplocarpon coronariae]